MTGGGQLTSCACIWTACVRNEPQAMSIVSTIDRPYQTIPCDMNSVPLVIVQRPRAAVLQNGGTVAKVQNVVDVAVDQLHS